MNYGTIVCTRSHSEHYVHTVQSRFMCIGCGFVV